MYSLLENSILIDGRMLTYLPIMPMQAIEGVEVIIAVED